MIYESERKALDALQVAGAWRTGFDDVATRALQSAELAPHVREIGLALAFSGRGMQAEARRHGQRALDAGITRPQAIEALVTGLLHGGYGIFWENLWIAENAPEAPRTGDPAAEVATAASVQAYFTDVWGGTLPAWIRLVGEADADLLAAYYRLRTDALGEGALPKKHKELLIALMSCVEHYDFGIDVHFRNALAAGATRAEVIDTVRASVIAGGIVAWVAGCELADKALTDAGK
ncbi:MAG TPA: carboxymuconolactone decarboxylase family protein [Acidimicrobiales bacterium]|jgi:alkylhydroperoxidase/carboxymuconolactone decarboxylase family protein YurZ|nr:carboxymuconolactone decarboxylase family protein [Acidimicrobiales bacterium]